MSTCDDYLKEHNFYDFQLISTMGFDKAGIDKIKENKDVKQVEGGKTLDLILSPYSEKSSESKDEKDNTVFKVHSMPDKINTLSIVDGRLPKAQDECVLDYEYAKDKKILGKYLEVSKENKSDDLEKLKEHKLKVVGIVNAPTYLNIERGTTEAGSGVVTGYIYTPMSNFDMDYFTEAYVKTYVNEPLHSKEYDKAIKKVKTSIKKSAEKAADLRYDEIVTKMMTLMSQRLLTNSYSSPSQGLSGASADLPSKPEVYVLDRDYNIGYTCFDSDTEIINSVSAVFPLFFILVAALVCMTTMTRLVDDNRTQIGVLKALGYGNFQVMNMYLFYSGSAAFLGSLAGFFIGTMIIPKVIWKAYGSVYSFNPNLNLVFNFKLGAICLIAALVCSMGSTMMSCLNDFKVVPAELIRPRAPKSGKKILLERITPLWNKIGFLYKISLRNIFRYKKRLFMMVIGISGCTALLVTGFGIKDSVSNIVDYQYGEIFHYDYAVNFKYNQDEKKENEFVESTKDTIKDSLFVHQSTVKFVKGKTNKSIRMVVSNGKDFGKFIDLHNKGKKVDFPKDGDVVISQRYARDYNVKVGDTITLRTDSMKTIKAKVSGIFENYIYTYCYMTPKTYKDDIGEEPDINSALVITKSQSKDAVYKSAAEVKALSSVSAITLNDEFKDRVNTMLGSLGAVIALVVISAGALAFIVLYNLTNINITERIREIATIKVLGFYPRETSSYVFRENFFLTGISAVVGLFLGKLLHSFVISKIRVDVVTFDTTISPMSFILSVVLTFVFAIIVSFVMYFKLGKISMTESLKSIE